MKTIKTKLRNKRVYFSTKLPSHNQVLKALNVCKDIKKAQKDQRSITDIVPLVICDRKLQHQLEIKAWLKNYPVYFVSAGEKLKSLDVFPGHINNILKKINSKKIAGFISLGGGSVGDFTGFVASVYKRGMPLIHIPSTWLSAMDSAHGGKTALNAGKIKNVLGSYCFPQAVFIVKELLFILPEKEKKSAKGELVKIALIEGGAFYTELLKKNTFSNMEVWNRLPQAVFAKLKIVAQDPYDKKGFRHLLNFGHTLGHTLESYFNIPHGEAVIYGIVFSIQWSHNRFILPSFFLKEVSSLIGKQRQLGSYLRNLPIKTLYQLLLQDKKRVSKERINFIFIKGPGKLFAENISVQNLLKEVQRQILSS